MKKTGLFVFMLFAIRIAAAQNIVPQIGVGSVLNYTVISTATGQQIPLTLNFISMNDPMKLKWTLTGLGTGSFIIPAKALESGTKMRLEEPMPGTDTQFGDSETIMFISKAAFSDMLKTRQLAINRAKFTVNQTTEALQVNDKPIDVYHAVTANGKVEVWILNNPNMPLICKFKGNPGGIDFDLTHYKE
ncbi:hypothetical protein BEL04_10520 [Mucilaginibacter sp. PPCGB 2223]|uniref:hypothetical protein n=1 Tax=Mucilaginibacter sp. PPCGB 2223 TaxID=1886027 RepID=UPI0008252873|nr:hypothetical protein [Mucilaginibacter sp. PPCGB 2223]OCX54651.1 hypothetical protein BEL04_10520 [Mucilaginibacter sp. PPCGB 2223]